MSAQILTPVVVFAVPWLVDLAVKVAVCCFMFDLSLRWIWMQRDSTTPIFVPPARSGWAKDVKSSTMVRTAKEPAIPTACKGRDLRSGAGQKPSPLSPCAASAHLLHVLTLACVFYLWKTLCASPGQSFVPSSLPIFYGNKLLATCQPRSYVLYVDCNFYLNDLSLGLHLCVWRKRVPRDSISWEDSQEHNVAFHLIWNSLYFTTAFISVCAAKMKDAISLIKFPWFIYLQPIESIIKTMGDRGPSCDVQTETFTCQTTEGCVREYKLRLIQYWSVYWVSACVY